VKGITVNKMTTNQQNDDSYETIFSAADIA